MMSDRKPAMSSPEEAKAYYAGSPLKLFADNLAEATSRKPSPEDVRETMAVMFLENMGLTPTPDAVGQLLEVFFPCLAIMCSRGYDPNGATWREGGWRSQLVDARKKFKRLWFHGWIKGIFIPDHGWDLINYVGYYQRIAMRGAPWGEWGEPENQMEIIAGQRDAVVSEQWDPE
jgi:hypothetical protein